MADLGKISVRITVATKELAAGLAKAGRMFKTFGVKVGAMMKKLTFMIAAQFKKLGTAIFNSMKRMLATVTRFAKLMGVAFGAFLLASVKAFANFDSAMTKSLAIMGDVSTQMQKQMEETAKTISFVSVTSAKELANAYFFLASAGLDAKQSIAALDVVNKFAVAGMFDMSRATDLSTDALSALGLKEKDAVKNRTNLIKVTDILVGANRLANATTEEFSLALTTQAGAAIKAYNIQVEDGVAVLAAYADQGVKGQQAGTMFSRMIRLLTAGFKKNRAEWDKFGINIFDAQGELKSMGVIVRDITSVLEGMSVQQKVATLDLLGFKARSQQAILPLLGLGDAIENYRDKLIGMKGITDEVAEKQLKSFTSQLKIAWNNIVGVSMAIGERLAPTIAKIGLWIRENRREIEDWAMAFADRVGFVTGVMVDFLALLKTDYHRGFQAITNSIIQIMQAFGVSLIELGFRIGEGVWKAIKQGMFNKGLSGEALRQATNEIYKDELQKRQDRLFGPDNNLPAPTGSRQTGAAFGIQREISDPALYKRAGEQAQQNWRRANISGIFDGFAQEIKTNFNKAFTDIAATNGETMDIIEKRMGDLALKDNVRKFTAMWQEIKDSAQPYVDTLINIKNKMTAAFKPEKKPGGPDEKKKRRKPGEYFQDWANSVGTSFQQISSVVSRSMGEISGSLTDLAMTGKADFHSMAESIIRDVMQMIIRLQMLKAVTGLFPSLSAPVPVDPMAVTATGSTGISDSYATGGIVGQTAAQIRVPPLAFAGAPSFQNGLDPDAFPAILHRGEKVTPAGSEPNVDINVTSPDVPIEAEVTGIRQAMDSMVIDVFVRAKRRRDPRMAGF